MNLWSHCFSQNTNKKLSGFPPCLVRAEILTIFFCILVEMMTSKIHSQIDWPFITLQTSVVMHVGNLNWAKELPLLLDANCKFDRWLTRFLQFLLMFYFCILIFLATGFETIGKRNIEGFPFSWQCWHVKFAKLRLLWKRPRSNWHPLIYPDFDFNNDVVLLPYSSGTTGLPKVELLKEWAANS